MSILSRIFISCFTKWVLVFLSASISSVCCYGHSPDELTYEIIISNDEPKNILVVHFTQKSAVDLVRSLHPELKAVSMINLNQYTSDIAEYFNDRIELYANLNRQTFEYHSADFTNHDATFAMSISQQLKPSDTIRLSTSAFQEIYKRVKNNVFVRNGSEYQECQLNDYDSVCTFLLNQKQHKSQKKTWIVYFGILMVLIFGLIYKVTKGTKVAF